ncbi:MAG: patatin-like phospholipase family protein [Deltaproteobacteria bacterium]|nr:patatin-like phospholipase family protein [Deltaproteobacteria bacterium]
MRSVVADPTWLAPPDESVLRWALSLARISAVQVLPHEGHAGVVDVGQATDALRQGLFHKLDPCVSPETGRIERDGVRAQMPHIRTLLRKERAAVLDLFGDRLPPVALDRATRRRPLALVMGGGGGTGYVYIGALNVLDEAGIAPSIIAGTSMGALLGAFRARTRQFSLGNVRQLLQRLSWKKVFRLFDTESRFGLPATLKLSLREVIGHEFLVDDNGDVDVSSTAVPGSAVASHGKRFMRMSEMAIPLRIVIAGLVQGERATNVNGYADLLKDVDDVRGLRSRAQALTRAFTEISRQPVRPLYIGGDPQTREFDVLDAIGFSSSVPGVIHYDILRDDPRMTNLVTELMRQEGVFRLVDGGLVDNLPAREAWRAVQDGAVAGERDPFVLALDAFAPQLTTRHLLFLPLMRIASENSRAGREQSHLVITFKGVLSPLAVVPSPAEFLRAVENGKREMAPHVPLIRKMIGPIPDPPGIFAPSA